MCWCGIKCFDRTDKPCQAALSIIHRQLDTKKINLIWAASWENMLVAYAKTKTQIRCVVTAQRICAFVFRFIESSILLLFSMQTFKPPISVQSVQSGSCLTWLETLKSGFLMTQLIYNRWMTLMFVTSYQEPWQRICNRKLCFSYFSSMSIDWISVFPCVHVTNNMSRIIPIFCS